MLDKIKQTSRTILFEEINPEMKDLITILSNNTGNETITDEVNQKLNEELAVNSFDDFLNKFKPCVYYSIGQNLEINYFVKKPTGVVNTIELTKEHSVIKMLINLIDNKKSNAQENYKFDYQTIIDALSPQKTVQEMKQKRKELNYLLEEYNKLEDGNPKKNEIGEKLDNSLNKISTLYNNPVALLPIAIEDAKQKIESTKKQSQSGENSKLLGTGYKMDFDEKGSLIAVKLLPQTNTIQEKKVVSNQLLLPEIIKQDYEEEAKEKNNFALTLIVNTLAPIYNQEEQEINIEEEQEKYDQYISVYESNLTNFIKQIKPLLQKIMGVYLFFAQCDIEKGKPNLFITNNTFEMTANNKDIMNKYFKYTNQGKNYESTFWFGIIPNINFNEETTENQGKSRFGAKKETVENSTNSITQMKTFLSEILNPFRIQTFFNFESRKETSFDFIAANGIKSFIEKSEKLIGNEYLISCFPNFTIVPDDKFVVNINEKTKAQMGGLYIDASYVAAGIVSGYQIPLYLEKIFGKTKVEKNLPGVRLNLEENDNNKKIKTTLGKEISGFTKSIEDEINRDCFGFVFSSDYDKISVMKARSLKKKENGNFEEIYKTTTSNYIRRYLEIMTEKNSEKIVKFFDAKNPKSNISELLKTKDNINGIFQAQDKVDYTEGNLNINYKGEEKIIEIEINNN